MTFAPDYQPRGLLDNPLMSIGQGLLAAGGYSTMPISTGQGLAQGMEIYRAHQQRAVEQQLAREKLTAYQQARVAEQQERERAERQRRAQQEAIREAAARDPRFAQIAQLAGVPGFEDMAGQYMFKLATQQPERIEPKVVGSSLVNPVTGEVVYREPRAPAQPRLYEVDGRLVNASGQVVYEGDPQGGGPKFGDVTTVRKEYQAESRNWTGVRDAYERINAAKPTAAGDMSLIFSFMKALDPGSVVRESEYATAQNAAGVPDQIRNLWNRVKDGQRLNPAQREDFKAQARELVAAAAATQRQREEQYRGIAARAGMNEKDVVRDLLGPYRNLTGFQAAPAPAAPPAGPTQRQPVSVNILTPAEQAELDSLTKEFGIR